MANCICVWYGGKGYALHGACPVHGPQPAPAEERSAAFEELLAAAEELAADLESEDIHCERLRAAIADIRGLKP